MWVARLVGLFVFQQSVTLTYRLLGGNSPPAKL
jgi:hypothetical protein